LGGCPVRFDTDRFPTETQLALEQDARGERFALIQNGESIDLGAIGAVWYRRVRAGNQLPADMGLDLRNMALAEIDATIRGLLAALPCFILDPPAVIRRADSKILQLQTARAAGLDTPPTLVTNDPSRLRAFAHGFPGGIVAKMASSFAVRSEGHEMVVFTTAVGAQDLENLEGLELSPMMFQERVPKALELRATVVGDRVFTAAIDSQASPRARDDWRMDGLALVDSWTRYELPRSVEERLLAVAERLGLNYGAADLILTPDDRHVFLEINPAGEYFWLENRPGLPISRAIAEVLLGLARRRT
ncbi:MAG TPA: MvdD family ATP-grasp ribosomal peptide maturase, partial [Thermoanaerobaculia bacterium]|nr:MvdD family ATP-grasp ribosomal peptide maturase [Thermoanaerobaculia bacterium]